MEESTKKKLHQIEIIGAIILLLVSVASFFPKPGITGYVSVETKKQKIDLTIANSQSYILTTNSQESFYITNLKISGKVVGNGIAKAYIMNAQGQKILIYSNIMEKTTGLDSITGMDKITGKAIGANSEETSDELIIEHLENIETEQLTKEGILTSGNFEDACIDSCFIEMMLNQDIAYQLLFYVEEGTILEVNEIVYTTRRD
jgi:hypothetical protein